MSFGLLIEMCGFYGFQNINKVYYRVPNTSIRVGDILRLVYNDSSMVPILAILNENGVIDIYVEHGNSPYPLLIDNNLIEICNRVGLNIINVEWA